MSSTSYSPDTSEWNGSPILVTGVAGFIGHHTAALLLDWGIPVVGVDCFTPYYDRALKQRHLDRLLDRDGFSFHEVTAASDECDRLLDGVRAVIHLAAQPGVRDSWHDFDTYVHLNVQTTKRLLDAALAHGVPRVVCASSSSVYGDAPAYPTHETAVTEPRSPYGITKLAADRLAVAYGRQHGLSTVNMRYFTVYGPGQRPDMAINRLIHAAHTGTTFSMFGDGSQIRDFTFVGDVARANCLAALGDVEPGEVFNVCSEHPVTLNDVIAEVQEATGRELKIERHPVARGDVARTGGCSDRISAALGWRAATSLADGIRAQDLESREELELAAAAS